MEEYNYQNLFINLFHHKKGFVRQRGPKVKISKNPRKLRGFILKMNFITGSKSGDFAQLGSEDFAQLVRLNTEKF
ncbi:hypothetical protein KCF3NO3_06790 [Chryseobacterium sp. KCF3-3]